MQFTYIIACGLYSASISAGAHSTVNMYLSVILRETVLQQSNTGRMQFRATWKQTEFKQSAQCKISQRRVVDFGLPLTSNCFN